MKKIPALMLSVSLALGSVTQVHAFTVIDVANLVQNTRSAILQLEQIQRQVDQLRNQATSLANEAKNLKRLDGDVVDRLRQTTRRVDQLMRRAQGIAFDIESSVQQFEALYPSQFAQAVSRDQMARDTFKRWQQSVSALSTTIRVQSQAAQNMADDEATLGSLVNRSQSAEGALQAAQVTNQLLALHARQLIQDQQLRIAQDRAMALEQARAVTANEQARAVRARFMTRQTRYTPEPIAAAR